MFEEFSLPVIAIMVLLLGFTVVITNALNFSYGKVPVARSPTRPLALHGKYPALGNVAKVDFNKLHFVLHDWSRQLGGIFSFKLHKKEIIVLSSYEAIFEALIEKGRDFAGRPSMYRTDHSGRSTHSIVWQTYTPKLQLLRKHVQRYLKVYGTGMDSLEERCKPGIDHLIKEFSNKDSSAFDPWDSIYPAVCNVVILLLLGKRLDHSSADFRKILEINRLFNQLFGPGDGQELDCVPWPSWRRDESYDRLRHALQLRDDFFEKQILPLKAPNSSAEDCILKSLLEYTELSTDSDVDITYDTVKEVFTNLLLAGTDTTATALTCLLLILVHHPDVQDRLQTEIDHAIPQRRLPTISDKQKMPYMDAVLLELSRYISHVPLAVPHSTTQDTSIRGYPVPANTTVYINLWSLHHDQTYWEDPWAFRPERFLDLSGKLILPDHPNRRRLLAFSAGRRVCLGETLAKNRMFLFASSLVQRFRFEPEVDKALPEMDPRSYEFGLVLHPKKFHIRAVPREATM